MYDGCTSWYLLRAGPMTTTFRETTCPGCGIRIPADEHAVYDGYYKVSPECWMLCTQVLGAEFGNALL